MKGWRAAQAVRRFRGATRHLTGCCWPGKTGGLLSFTLFIGRSCLLYGCGAPPFGGSHIFPTTIAKHAASLRRTGLDLRCHDSFLPLCERGQILSPSPPRCCTTSSTWQAGAGRAPRTTTRARQQRSAHTRRPVEAAPSPPRALDPMLRHRAQPLAASDRSLVVVYLMTHRRQCLRRDRARHPMARARWGRVLAALAAVALLFACAAPAAQVRAAGGPLRRPELRP